MDAYLAALKEGFFRIALQPGNAQDWVITGFAWAIGAWLAMKLMALILGNTNEGLFSDLFHLVLAGGTMLCAAAVADRWLVPLAGDRFAIGWPIALAWVALLCVATPLFRRQQRTGYLAALMTLVVALCAAALANLAARSITDGIRAGRDQLNRDESRRIEINQMFE